MDWQRSIFFIDTSTQAICFNITSCRNIIHTDEVDPVNYFG